MTDTMIKELEMAILTGELKPRERLVESELISRFNAKRFSVRKAIQELAHLGFVELTPNKGARVADISDKEVDDVYRVRMSLEFLAADLLIEKMTPAKLSRIKKVQKDYVEAVKSGLFEEMVLSNEAFHRTLYQMTENRFLAEHLEKLTNTIFALRYNAYFLLGIAQKTVADHESMIEAIERRDAGGLKRILKKSIIYPKMIYLSRKVSPLSPETLEKRERRGQAERHERRRGLSREERARSASVQAQK